MKRLPNKLPRKLPTKNACNTCIKRDKCLITNDMPIAKCMQYAYMYGKLGKDTDAIASKILENV